MSDGLTMHVHARRPAIPYDLRSVIDTSYLQGEAHLREYCELMLAAWMGRFPNLRPEDAQLVVDDREPGIRRLYIERRKGQELPCATDLPPFACEAARAKR